MTEAKFTKGPWLNSDRSGRSSQFNVFSGDGRSICSTGSYSDGTEKTFFENISNARLIAAAPELLEALYDALGVVEKTSNTIVYDKMFAAIQKATKGDPDV